MKWSGKQLFSLLLKPSKKSLVLVNVEITNKQYNKSLNHKYFDSNEGYILIKNSILICGKLCKASLGDGSKQGIIFSLVRDNSLKAGVFAMNRISKFASRYMSNIGFTIGLGDVTPTKKVTEEKKLVLQKQYNICER